MYVLYAGEVGYILLLIYRFFDKLFKNKSPKTKTSHFRYKAN